MANKPKRPSIGNVKGPASKPKPNTAKPTAAKPSSKPPARLGRIAGRISMGGLKGGLIGLVGGAAAEYVGTKAGQALGTAIRKAAEPKVTGTRTGRTGRGGTTADKPPAKMDRPNLRFEKMYDTGASRSAYGLKDKPTPQSTPTRQDATPPTRPQRSTAPSRPAASRPAATPKPKPESAPKPPKVAETSGIGPVKEGAEYARKKGSISEKLRELREMRKRSEERQKKT